MMSTKVKLIACLAGAIAPWLLTAGAVSADEQFAVTKIITVPGTLNSFDIGFTDPDINTYVLADRTNKSVDVVDTSTNTLTHQYHATPGFVGVVASPANASGPNGLIIVDHREAWAADGPVLTGCPVAPATTPPCTVTTPSTIKVIDLVTGATTHVIPNGGKRRADELCEDVKREMVLVANDDAIDNFLTFISSETYGIVQKIFLDGNDANGKITLSPPPAAGAKVAADGIEQCKFNPRTDAYYLAVPATTITVGAVVTPGPGVILKISKHAPFHVLATFTIATATGCTGPQGLAIGPHHQIILGCGGASTASLIIDDRDGHVIHSLAGSGGADMAWYNPGDNQYFLALSNNAVPQLGVIDPNGEKDPITLTAAGSHSVAADPLTNQVYVPGNKAAAALCGQLGSGQGANGCIAVFAAPNDDKCLAHGMPVIDHDDDDDPLFLRVRCHRDDDDHDRHEARNEHHD
jgi:hypothetical protein